MYNMLHWIWVTEFWKDTWQTILYLIYTDFLEFVAARFNFLSGLCKIKTYTVYLYLK